MPRGKWTMEDSAVSGDLKFWGYHEGRVLAWEGYSVANTVSRLLEGQGGGFGHKVLTMDLRWRSAQRFWPIHQRILRLPLELRAVLIARYCVPPKEAHGQVTYYSQAELAEALDVPIRTYQYRLSEAKRRYKNMLFGSGLQLSKVV